MFISPLRKTKLLLLMLVVSFSITAQQTVLTDTLPKSKKNLFKKFYVPAGLVVLGTTGSITDWGINKSIRNKRNKQYPGFHHNADNYLQYGSIPVVYAMDAMGLRAKHNWKEQTVFLLTAEVLMNGMVQSIKRVSNKTRPDSSADNSFPSGHTAQAFLAASFFNKEFGGRYPWLSAGMYTVATTVGVFRILNNRHWLSDIIAGAGFGILSVELAYLLERKIKKLVAGNIPYVIPSYQNGSFACTAVFKL